MEKEEREVEATASKLRMESPGRREITSNLSNTALTNPSLRDLPIVIISAWRDDFITSPQTVTFDSFLANYNKANRPGGGDGVLELNTGIFTCTTPGYYTVSFSVYTTMGPDHDQHLFLYKNGMEVPGSRMMWYADPDALTDFIGVTSSRIVVSCFLKWIRLPESSYC